MFNSNQLHKPFRAAPCYLMRLAGNVNNYDRKRLTRDGAMHYADLDVPLQTLKVKVGVDSNRVDRGRGIVAW